MVYHRASSCWCNLFSFVMNLTSTNLGIKVYGIISLWYGITQLLVLFLLYLTLISKSVLKPFFVPSPSIILLLSIIGNSAVQAISLLLQKGVQEANIIFLNLISVSSNTFWCYILLFIFAYSFLPFDALFRCLCLTYFRYRVGLSWC